MTSPAPPFGDVDEVLLRLEHLQAVIDTRRQQLAMRCATYGDLVRAALAAGASSRQIARRLAVSDGAVLERGRAARRRRGWLVVTCPASWRWLAS